MLIDLLLYPDIARYTMIPFAAALLIPRRLFFGWRGWALLQGIILAVVFSQFFGDELHLRRIGYLLRSSPFSLLSAPLFFTILITAFAAYIALARLLVTVTLCETAQDERSVRYRLQAAINGMFALVAALLIVYRLHLADGTGLRDLRPAWLSHAVLLAAVVALGAASWGLTRLLRARWRSGCAAALIGGMDFAVRRLCIGFAVILLAGAVWPILVLQRAEAIAGGEPYCIQTPHSGGLRRAPSGGDYLAVQSALDLSPLSMRGRMGRGTHSSSGYTQRHGILIVGGGSRPKLYHWSYRNLDFVADPYNELHVKRLPALYCAPRADFAAALPWLLPQADELFRVRIAGKLFEIPPAYQPRINGGGSPYFFFATEAPDFAPLDRSLGIGKRGDWLNDVVWVDLAPSPDDLTSRAKIGNGEQATRESVAYGLARREIRLGAAATPRIDYIARDRTGRVLMLAQCDPDEASAGARCRQHFFHDGMLIRFFHAAADMRRWQVLQAALVARLESWEVEEQAP
ncbi:MAG TPA: hypothetical protein VH835_08125 [Dongiaceae bacterium]